MNKKNILRGVAGVFVCALVLGAFLGYRAHRLYRVGTDMRSEVRYLIESGGTLGGAPAKSTFSASYLSAIFGEDPALLSQLKGVVEQGLSEDPALNLGEVAAMIVTYRRNENGDVEDVAAHVIGGFPLGERRKGMHRDGYFKHLVDNNLWNLGNTMVGFLGRDMVIFADESTVSFHEKLFESCMGGDVLPLADSLDRTLYYTAVFPNPRRLVPPQLRNHVQALVVKGEMAKDSGATETIILTPSSRSAAYTLSILSDLKMASEIALKTKWGGTIKKKEWGNQVDAWWAHEMVQNSENSILEKEENIVRIRSKYGRVMVNAILKSIERMGRDLEQMRMSLAERMDPRLVDRKMATRKPGHYWSEEHKWGPNWPIPPSSNEVTNTEKTVPDFSKNLSDEVPSGAAPKVAENTPQPLASAE